MNSMKCNPNYNYATADLTSTGKTCYIIPEDTPDG